MKAIFRSAVLVAAVLAAGSAAQAQQFSAGLPSPGMGYGVASPYGVMPAAYAQEEAAAATSGGGSSCSNCSSCGGGGCGDCCDCDAPWKHRTRLWGEFLYLNVNDAEVPYAVAINGPNTTAGVLTSAPVQISPVQLVDPDYHSNFRVGGSRCLCDEASIDVSYTRFDSIADGFYSIANPGPNDVLRNLTSHPRLFNAINDSLTAAALYEINFQVGDIDYSSVVACGDLWAVNFVAGARYAHLEQKLHTQFTDLGTENVLTNVSFDGGGMRIGLDGEKHSCSSGLFVYGKTFANFVSGKFRTSYHQDTLNSAFTVDTAWTAGRVISMLELEMGAGWQSKCGTYRATAGYMFSGWYNVVKTSDWIHAVQVNDYRDMSGSITFDGLVARFEVRY